jgi:dienelactone hydrolase
MNPRPWPATEPAPITRRLRRDPTLGIRSLPEELVHAIPFPAPRTERRLALPGLPSPRRLLGAIAVVAIVTVASTLASTLVYLRVPAPTGAFAVGRADTLLVDETRREPGARGGRPRAVRLVAWYPATVGSGAAAEYVPGYDRVRAGLEASGELSPIVVRTLPLVGTSAREEARIADDEETWPVIVFSPGNATNVAFYAALAEDLASRGYVVIGVDHPYQVAAVDVGAAGVAVYDPVESVGEGSSAARIDERVSDLSFVVDRLAADAGGIDELSGRLDLGRIGVAGHSLGGIAAAEMCADARVDACLNIDGQQIGGPFSARRDPSPPTKPFLFLTKETRLHPALVEVFEAAGADAYRVVVPAATHGAFTDGSRYEPRLLPVDGTADHVLAIERGVVRAYFDRYLRDVTGPLLDGLPAPTDIYAEVYPLRGRPTLPAG